VPEMSQEHQSYDARWRIRANLVYHSVSNKTESLIEVTLLQITLLNKEQDDSNVLLRVLAICAWKNCMQAKNNSRPNSYFYHGFSERRVRPVVYFQQHWELQLQNLVINLFFLLGIWMTGQEPVLRRL